MDNLKLTEFYERLYFQSIEIRDKINSRIQMVFAILFASLTVISYMIRTFDYDIAKEIHIWFFILIGFSILLLLLTSIYLARAFWGNVYNLLPPPDEIEQHRVKFEKYIKDIIIYNNANPKYIQDVPKIDAEMMDFVSERLRGCTTTNTFVNINRGEHLHHATKYVFFAALPLAISCVIFAYHDLDVSSPRKASSISKIEIKKSIDNLTEALSMANLRSIEHTDKPTQNIKELKVKENKDMWKLVDTPIKNNATGYKYNEVNNQ